MDSHPLASVEWLAEHLEDPDLRIFDATVQVGRRFGIPVIRSGEREWRREHIPGSSFADLFTLSDPHRPKRSMTMPTPEWFAARVGELGIANDSEVVAYDRRGFGHQPHRQLLSVQFARELSAASASSSSDHGRARPKVHGVDTCDELPISSPTHAL